MSNRPDPERDFCPSCGSHARLVERPIPPTETRTCPHGCTLGVSHLVLGEVWAAPISRCRCCLGDFGYIDRAQFGSHRVVTDTWTPKDLCGQCGGRYVHCDSAEPAS